MASTVSPTVRAVNDPPIAFDGSATLDEDAATAVTLSGFNQGTNNTIYVTASASADEKADCLHAGMNDILSKPFSEEDLSRLLVSWLAPGAHQAAKTE